MSGQRIITTERLDGHAHGSPRHLVDEAGGGPSDPSPPFVVPSFVSLRGRHAFSRVYREGRRSRSGDVTMFAAPGDPGPPQIGFVAGRRVGSAVRRNRAKRRLREAARSCRQLTPGTAYVVVAGRSVPDVAFDRLSEWLAKVPSHGGSRQTAEQEKK